MPAPLPVPPVIPGNAPEGVDAPGYLPEDPRHPDHPDHPDHPSNAPVVTPEPEPMAPGVYTGVYPNLTLTAYADENGDIVQVPEVTP